jgi:hypothetical protein
MDLATGQRERLAQGFEHALRKPGDLVCGGSVINQNGEFVAARPGELCPVAGRRA